jgi:hypothetical protein
MPKYAQIKNGVVVNVIEAKSTDGFDPAYTWALADDASIGWKHDGSVFSDPNTPSAEEKEIALPDLKEEYKKELTQAFSVSLAGMPEAIILAITGDDVSKDALKLMLQLHTDKLAKVDAAASFDELQAIKQS